MNRIIKVLIAAGLMAALLAVYAFPALAQNEINYPDAGVCIEDPQTKTIFCGPAPVWVVEFDDDEGEVFEADRQETRDEFEREFGSD